MKTRTFVSILILILAVFVIVGSSAKQKQAYIPKTNEELYGTWVNTDYAEQKFIHHNWGYCEFFLFVTDQTANIKGTFQIRDKWVGSDGNLWYIATCQYYGTPVVKFYLVKVDENEGIREEVWDYKDFPSEDDLIPEQVQYVIWYRQE